MMIDVLANWGHRSNLIEMIRFLNTWMIRSNSGFPWCHSHQLSPTPRCAAAKNEVGRGIPGCETREHRLGCQHAQISEVSEVLVR